ncbi:hypothetical protein GYMLUDRAFT_67366 [Collybiopsis luxurians FD-317 M1]|nr:hypothetical protein GYMLUDRAFT_67366 [Collybiopsis luxurians FD-317 M1]
MRFFTLAAFAFVAVAAHKSQPSQTASTGFYCPDTDNNGMSKIESLCDAPPHRSTSFGCTFRGKTSSTSTLQCVYDVVTGKCTSAHKDCPKSAFDLSKRSVFSKRAASPAPAVPGSRHYAKRINV